MASAAITDLSFARRADDVLVYVDSIGEPTRLAGWSGGGSTAPAVAAQSDAIDAVAPIEPVVICLADGQEKAALGGAIARMAEQAADGRLAAAARAFAGWPFNDEDIAAAAAVGNFETAGRYAPNLLNLLQQLMQEGPIGDDPAVVGGITAPVLVLHGSDTRAFFAASARHVADHAPNARIHQIPGACHASP